MSAISLAERIIVVPYFCKEDLNYGRSKAVSLAINLARVLECTDIIFGLSSALIRAQGYQLIEYVQCKMGLKVFADLRIAESPERLDAEIGFLKESKPMMATVMCAVGYNGMRLLKNELPDTQIFGIPGVITNHGYSPISLRADLNKTSLNLAAQAKYADIEGIVIPAAEASIFRNLQLRKIMHGIYHNSLTSYRDRSTFVNAASALRDGAERIIIEWPVALASEASEEIRNILTHVEGLFDKAGNSDG